MTSLTSLIERIEAAKGSDGKLNAEIACAIHFPALRPARPDDHKKFQNGIPPGDSDIWCPTGFLQARDYTGSIDAALTLLPEGLDWLVRTGDRAAGGRPYGHVYEGNTYGLGEAFAATPALALLAAILRARQTEKSNDES